MKRGRGKTMTHDCQRNGVTTWFAAMNTLTGQVLSMTEQPHRHQEWLRFLKLIHHQTPKKKELHLVVDNYATHKHPEVQAWLAQHPRFHVHFTPTRSSWLNMVERFFRDVTDKRIRRGVIKSVPDLEAAIDEYTGRLAARRHVRAMHDRAGYPIPRRGEIVDASKNP